MCSARDIFLHFCQNLVECLCDLFGVLSSLFVVLISLLIVLISLLLVGFNGGFNGKELVIGLGIHLVTPSGILKLGVERVVIYGADGR